MPRKVRKNKDRSSSSSASSSSSSSSSSDSSYSSSSSHERKSKKRAQAKRGEQAKKGVPSKSKASKPSKTVAKSPPKVLLKSPTKRVKIVEKNNTVSKARRQPTDYNLFVKSEHPIVKKLYPNLNPKELLGAIAERWRAKKGEAYYNS